MQRQLLKYFTNWNALCILLTLLIDIISGLISWHDFHVHFLVAKGYDDKTAQKHATDYETIPLNPDGNYIQ